MARSFGVSFVLLLILINSPPAQGLDLENEPTVYMVAVSHLDTQWWWTIHKTITDLIPATFSDTFDQLDAFPDYVFSWEGAHRYMLLREYNPDLWDRLPGYVASGQWRPAGSALEGGDVNVPSPESLIRQFLYGNDWFERELGARSVDVFLPDCFGFGWALPSVAAHCGLIGFSTQKLGWGSAAGVPFDIGAWEGPDGNSVVAALDPGSYISSLSGELTSHAGFQAEIDAQDAVSGLEVAYRYFGVGDQGGSAPWDSVETLMDSLDGDGPLTVLSVASDQLFRDLTPAQVGALPRWDSELLLTTHATGAYTSQAAMKRWNRKNELLGDATERAAVAAEWLGALPYPREKLTDAWIRFLVHQFHDDIPGTGIPEIYTYSWNDEILALNRFASTLTRSVGGVARALDTTAEGIPLVVYNPLSIQRQDVVEARVRFPTGAPPAVQVFAPDGEELPAQVVGVDDDALDLLILVDAAPVSFVVLDVRPADAAGADDGDLSVGAEFVENTRYRVEVDAAGDLSRVYDKELERELLSAPARLALFDDGSPVWPAWEILYIDLVNGPREHVGGTPEIEVVEEGPVRVALEVRRNHGDTAIVQTIRLAGGSAGDRVEVDLALDWKTMASLLKATFPLAADGQATYDLGLGAIERGVNTETLYEVPAQQWVDLTDASGDFGVTLMSDCKYGWDRPDAKTLRLTLLHTPLLSPMSGYYGQFLNDVGRHRVVYGLAGHAGGWRGAAPWAAARLNQPLLAFQVPAHEGVAAALSLLSVDTAQVAVRALKAAEDGDGYVVRLQELHGVVAEGVHVAFGDGIESAAELDGSENPLGPAQLVDDQLVLGMQPFGIRTFRLRPLPPAASLEAPETRPVSLPYDVDAVSTDEDRGDGEMDPFKAFPRTWAAPLFPEEILDDGIRFVLGPTGPGEANAVACAGQTIPIDAQPGDSLHLLMGSVRDRTADFAVGDQTTSLDVQYWTGWVGQWDSRVADPMKDPTIEIDEIIPAFVKPSEVALYGTHRHRPDGDEPFVFTYLFRYVLPVPDGATELVLPKEPDIRLFAATLAPASAAEVVAATSLHDGFVVDAHRILWEFGADAPPTEIESGPETPPTDVGSGPETPPTDGAGGKAGCSAGAAPQSPSWLLLVLVLVAISRRRTSASSPCP